MSAAHVPLLSRKITACKPCRDRKVKCVFPEGAVEPPCIRCIKSGSADLVARCKVDKNLQSILDGDKEWKEEMEDKLERTMRKVQRLARKLRELDGGEESSSADSSDEDDEAAIMLPSVSQAGKRRRLEESTEPTDIGAQAAAAPGVLAGQLSGFGHGSSSQTTVPAATQDAALAARSVLVQLRRLGAEELFEFYKTQLDPLLFGICADHRPTCGQPSEGVDALVKNTTGEGGLMLAVAICAVSALHRSRLDNRELLSTSAASAGRTSAVEVLYNDYVRLSALQAFSRNATLGDLRALLLGSFHFRELSWILTSIAVRIATERGLQESFRASMTATAAATGPLDRDAPLLPPSLRNETSSPRASAQRGVAEAQDATQEADGPQIAAQRKAYQEAVLFYQIYIADHQASIPFARPPMTRQHAAVRGAKQWLEACPLTTRRDGERSRKARCMFSWTNLKITRGPTPTVFIVSQVALWEIAHDILDEFGTDVHQPLTPAMLSLEGRFDDLLKAWQVDWAERLRSARTDERDRPTSLPDQDELSQHLLLFDYHAMRLYLKSHAFRGPDRTLPSFNDQSGQSHLRTMAVDAIYAAHAILRSAAEQADCVHYCFGDVSHLEQVENPRIAHLAPHLLGLPIYASTMIGFAAVFLVRVARSEASKALPRLDPEEVIRSVRPTAEALQKVARRTSSHHVASSLAKGMLDFVESLRSADKTPSVNGHPWRQTVPHRSGPQESSLPRGPASSTHFATASGTRSVLLRESSGSHGAPSPSSMHGDPFQSSALPWQQQSLRGPAMSNERGTSGDARDHVLPPIGTPRQTDAFGQTDAAYDDDFFNHFDLLSDVRTSSGLDFAGPTAPSAPGAVTDPSHTLWSLFAGSAQDPPQQTTQTWY